MCLALQTTNKSKVKLSFINLFDVHNKIVVFSEQEFGKIFAILSDKRLDLEKSLIDYNIQNGTVIQFWQKRGTKHNHVFAEEDPEL